MGERRALAGIGMRSLIIGVLFVSALTLAGCKDDRPAEWSVPLSPDDAFRLSAIILARGDIRGCGQFEVKSQHPRWHEIEVECGSAGNTRTHRLEYWPKFTVDGKSVSDSAWDDTWLSKAYCVKRPDGAWDMAYIELGDAHDRAQALSAEVGHPIRFYAADSLVFWESHQAEDGTWATGAPLDEVRERDERRGCELEKSPLQSRED